MFSCLFVRDCAKFLCSFSFVHIKEIIFFSTAIFKNVKAATVHSDLILNVGVFGLWNLPCEEFHARTLHTYQSPVGKFDHR